MAICDTLLSKEDEDGVKLTSLAGDIGSNSEARAAVLPQKKALKRFLAKYPQYFVVKEDTVHSGPNVSINEFKLKLEAKKNEILKKENAEDIPEMSNANGHLAISTALPVENKIENISNNKEKSASDVFAVFQSEQGVKLLSDILIKYGRAMKIGDLLKSCQYKGWAGMKTTAMLTQLIQKKKSIFGFDEAGHVYLTDEGKRQVTFGVVSTKKKEESPPIKPNLPPNTEKNLNEFPTPYESMLLRLSQPNSSFPQAELSQSEMLGCGSLASSVFNTSSNLAVGSRIRPAFATTNAAGNLPINTTSLTRKAYNPVTLPGGDFLRMNNESNLKNPIVRFP